MILFEQVKKSANIDALYNYAKSNGITLFPTENYDFWAAYDAAYQKFDRYFYQKYRAFKVMQDYEASASDADMLSDFKAIIDAHFFMNAKRYSELYRVQVLANDAYDVVNNYDLNETIMRRNTGTVADARGARSDSATKGAASTQTAYGERSSSNATTLGNQTSTSTQSRSAFNAGELVEVQGGNIANGARSDSATLTEQAHTDSTTEAARTDSATIGAQTNTRTDDLTENTTIRRYGNIGVQTPADVIGGHIDLWQAFKFYQMIFDEIAAEYLVIDVDFDFCGGNACNATLISGIVGYIDEVMGG